MPILDEHDLDAKNRAVEQHVIDLWARQRAAVEGSSTAAKDFYTLHDETHCRAVANKLNQLLKRDLGDLNLQERYVLHAAAWMHDLGMIPVLLKGDDPTDPEHMARVRREHHLRVGRYIKQLMRSDRALAASLGLDEQLAAAVELVCRFHRRGLELTECPEELDAAQAVRTQLLAAYLRIADAAEVDDPTRAPESMYRAKVAMGMDAEATFHWLRAQYLEGTRCSPDQMKITVLVKCPDAAGWSDKDVEPLSRLMVEELQDELDSAKETLIRGGLSKYLLADSEIVESEMSDTAIRDLKQMIGWIDTRFARNAGTAIDRVLDSIQTCLDSSGTIEEKLENLRFLATDILHPFLKERPCHVFHRNVEEFLDEVLNDVAAGGSASDGLQAVEKRLEGWRKDRVHAQKAIPEMARPFVSGANPILLYGYSGSVIAALADHPDRKKMPVFVCEGRPKTRYGYNNRLRYCDGMVYASELLRLGFKEVYVVPDAAASNLLSRGKVTKVLFGANGVAFDGAIAHSLGHLEIANAAAAYGVPVYVIAEVAKVGEFGRYPELLRDQAWLSTDRTQSGEFHKAKRDLEVLQEYNPRGDVVPPDRIAMIITEKAAVLPNRVFQDLVQMG